MIAHRRTNTCITIFVICWILLFGYETFRHDYLSPLAGRRLPKLPLLFPPAGWIMFYQVDHTYGFAEVYGIRNGQPFKIDPHAIFETKALGYDNIHRNVLVGVLYRDRVEPFCGYVKRKFPEYDWFAVVYGQYPNVIDTPEAIHRQVMYRCPASGQ